MFAPRAPPHCDQTPILRNATLTDETLETDILPSRYERTHSLLHGTPESTASFRTDDVDADGEARKSRFQVPSPSESLLSAMRLQTHLLRRNHGGATATQVRSAAMIFSIAAALQTAAAVLHCNGDLYSGPSTYIAGSE